MAAAVLVSGGVDTTRGAGPIREADPDNNGRPLLIVIPHQSMTY
jgi:hypothetical protein